MAINDVIAHVPDCLYGFANDGVAKWKDAYAANHILFQPSRCFHEYDPTRPGAVACKVVPFADTCEDRNMELPPVELAKCLSIRRGTLGSAIQILHIMGIRTVHMVGIDGGGRHADGFEWKTRLRHDHAKYYDAIKSSAIDTAAILGMTLKFHNKSHTMETNGRIFVRMTRNCFAQAEPYSAGEIASFSPKIAHELVSNRCAEHYAPPAQTPIKPAPVIETAESRVMKAAENTTIRTAKNKASK